MFDRIRRWLLDRCADIDAIPEQRACILLRVDTVAFVLSIVAGFFVIYYLRLPITNTEAWSSFGVTAGALVSGALVIRGNYWAAAHVGVAVGFASIWTQVFERAGVLSTQSAVTYVVAILTLPALFLGRTWTLAYLAATLVLTALTSAHLAMAHHFSRADASTFGIDIMAGAVFVVFITMLMTRIYENALESINSLLCAQQAHVAEVTDLSESLRRSEAHKHQFYRDTIYSVTSGKLTIYEDADLDPYLESAEVRAEVSGPQELADARHKVTEFCTKIGLTGERLESFAIGVGEAMTNAVKHAHGGTIHAGTADGSIWVGISDDGPGIESLILPRALLLPGFSTKPSLGLGYTIMLDVSDRILLKTSESGTTVLLFKHIIDQPDENAPAFGRALIEG